MSRQTSVERRQSRFATIEKYLSSALTQKQFCHQQQLAYATFQFWLKKYRQTNGNARRRQPDSDNFVPLTFAAPLINSNLSHYVIEYPNGVVLRVNAAIEPATLIALIRASGA